MYFLNPEKALDTKMFFAALFIIMKYGNKLNGQTR